MASERRPDDAPATVGDIRKLMKRIKQLDSRIDDWYDERHSMEDAQGEFFDKLSDDLDRIRRQVRRIEKGLESDDEG